MKCPVQRFERDDENDLIYDECQILLCDLSETFGEETAATDYYLHYLEKLSKNCKARFDRLGKMDRRKEMSKLKKEGQKSEGANTARNDKMAKNEGDTGRTGERPRINAERDDADGVRDNEGPRNAHEREKTSTKEPDNKERSFAEQWCERVANLQCVKDMKRLFESAETTSNEFRECLRYLQGDTCKGWIDEDLPVDRFLQTRSIRLLYGGLDTWKLLICCGLNLSDPACVSEKMSLEESVSPVRSSMVVKERIMRLFIPKMVDGSSDSLLSVQFRQFYKESMQCFADFNQLRPSDQFDQNAYESTEFMPEFEAWLQSYPRLLAKSWLLAGYGDEGLLPLTRNSCLVDVITAAIDEMRLMLPVLKQRSVPPLNSENFSQAYFVLRPKTLTPNLDILVSSLVHFWLEAATPMRFKHPHAHIARKILTPH